MKKLDYLLLLLSAFFFYNCSSSQSSVDEQENKNAEIYVFDDVEKTDSSTIDSTTIESPDSIEVNEDNPSNIIPIENKIDSTSIPKSVKYIVQVGAFSKKENAESFIKEYQEKIDFQMFITYNEISQLFLVQIPPFNTRQEAENIRNKLRQMPGFKGAFIITEE